MKEIIIETIKIKRETFRVNDETYQHLRESHDGDHNFIWDYFVTHSANPSLKTSIAMYG